MNKALSDKVKITVNRIRKIWPSLEGKRPFIAFSTGKDSLALAAMIYEAIEQDPPLCLYVHHKLEFATNLEYLEILKDKGFKVQVLKPFLEYFELMDRGIEFITRTGAWCIPMLIGTGIIGWLQQEGARSPREAIMFRGMSGSEYSHKWHSSLELYQSLDLPCFNFLLEFSTEEILEVLSLRYALPLNPIYEHMDRTYCIVCYTSDARSRAYSSQYFPEVCQRYYSYIEKMLFDSGLLAQSAQDAKYKSYDEKIKRHGFKNWRRSRAQSIVGAIKYRISPGVIGYRIRDSDWISPKHLFPLKGNGTRRGNEIRFWNVPEQSSDVIIKRMINCLDCGFCTVECFPCRKFDRKTGTLKIEGCIQCGNCLQLKFCKGWNHRFWRRIIVEEN